MPKKDKNLAQKSDEILPKISDLGPKKCFEEIICSIPEPKKSELKAKIESVRASLSWPKPGSYWKDPVKKTNAILKMKESWSHRKPNFSVTYRDGGYEMILKSIEEVAELTHLAAGTLKVYLSRGPYYTTTKDEDIIKIRKIKNNSLHE